MESIQYDSTCCSNKKPRHTSGLIISIVLMVVVISGVWHWSAYKKSREVQPDKDLYQSVLLSNNQLFFGKLHTVRGPFSYLTDVYYLQETESAVTADGQVLSGKGRYNVIKRGLKEIYAPTDKLFLNNKDIVYWENVSADSTVAKGIKTEKEYRATGKAPEGVPVVDTSAIVPAAPVVPTASTSTTPASTPVVPAK